MSDQREPTYFVVVQEEGGPKTRVDLTDRVMSLSYEDNEKEADLLRLEVTNWDLANFDDPIWRPGNTIFAAWGYPGSMSRQHNATITSVKGSTTLTVEAQGTESRLNRKVKSRTFRGMTRAQVVRQIAIENGFDASQLLIEDTEVEFETLVQAQQTDAEFLRRIAEIEGMEWFVDVDDFHFHTRHVGNAPTKTLTWYPLEGKTPNVGDILYFDIESDIYFSPKQKAGKVTVKARDPITKTDITAVGADAETVRDKTSPIPMVVGPEGTGGEVQSTQVTEYVRPTTQTSKAAVKREADGAYRRMQQNTVELNLTIIGDPHIAAKTVVKVLNISKRYSGYYYVKKITHKLGTGGFTSEMVLTSDGVNSVGKISGAASTSPKASKSKGKLNDKPTKDPEGFTPQMVPNQPGMFTTPGGGTIFVHPNSPAADFFYPPVGKKPLPAFDPNNPAAAFLGTSYKPNYTPK